MKKASVLLAVLLCALAGLSMFWASPAQSTPEDVLASQILTATGLQGGLIVHLNCGDGKLTAALGSGESYQAHGLDPDTADVTAARTYITDLSAYGRLSIQEYDFDTAGTLPYIENLVNLIVSEVPVTVPMAEILRVLAPEGIAYIHNGTDWVTTVKPRPAEMDEWGHYLHDASNNAVSNDTMVQPPERFQWLGSPRYSRHHDHMASISSYIAANGRVFYIMDESSRASIQMPGKWSLFARDAFNGTILWKKPVDSWVDQMWPLKSGPAQLPRRMVAVGDRVYTTLGLDGTGLSMLDAATGETLWTGDMDPNTVMTEELIYSDGVVFAMVKDDPPVTTWDDYIRQSKNKVAEQFVWDEQNRWLMAIDAADGSLIWQVQTPITPLSMGADPNSVYFHDGDNVVCLNRFTGSQTWASAPVTRKSPMPVNLGSTLVIYDDVVVFLGYDSDRTITGLSAKTGEILWSDFHAKTGHNCPYDLLAVNDLAWVGDIASGGGTGIFTGWDPNSGDRMQEFPPDVETYWFHHRCYRARATVDYLLTSRTGIEFVDVHDETWKIHHWIRGGCLYGILPANGLIYTAPNNCACYLESKTYGFTTVAPAHPDPGYPNTAPDSVRRTEGPAYGTPMTAGPSSAADWPTYRYDANRSGHTPAVVPADLSKAWEVNLGGKLSTMTIADGQVYIAQIDEHTLHALSEADGSPLWQFRADGRVDSPPTIYRGRVIFGSADGNVYCLRATDGEIIWQYRGAPEDLQMTSNEQIESVWPLHGSVLLQNGEVYCVAGRNMFLDGGLRFLRLNPETGERIDEVLLDDRDPETGGDLQMHVTRLSMPTSLPDVLSSDGDYIYMHSQRFDMLGNREDIAPFDYDFNVQGSRQYGVGMHLFSPTGFLDDNYMHRSYWIWGMTWVSGAGGYHRAGAYAPAGKMMVFDDDKVYAYGRQPQYWKWTTPIEYQLFAAEKYPESETITYHWVDTATSIFVQAMVLADKVLFTAGPEDILDDHYTYDHREEPAIQVEFEEQAEIFNDEQGGLLRAVLTNDGRQMAQYTLESMPVWDGMVAANNKLYLALKNGSVICFEGGNFPPAVDIGPDRNVMSTVPALLDATVTDDDLPLPAGVTTGWSKVYGPGTVTFADPNSIDTTATFSEPGKYTLRLDAHDGGAPYFDDVQLTAMRPGDMDADNDNDVDEEDLKLLIGGWLLTGCSELNDWCGALNQATNGTVGADSLAVVALNWLLGIEPEAPTGLTATGGEKQISLQWDENREHDMAGYNVYRSDTPGSSYEKANSSLVTTTDYIDIPDANMITWYYVVKAVDTLGHESLSYSNESSASKGPLAGVKFIAGTGVVVDANNLVTRWRDQGNDNDATQPLWEYRPAYLSSAINGQPALDFAGAGVHLNVADSTDINKSGPFNAKTLTVVFKTSSDVSTKQIIWEQGGNNKGGLTFYIDGGILYINGWTLNTTDAFPDWGQAGATVNTAVSPDTVYVASLVMDSVAEEFKGYVNGDLIETYTPAYELPTHGNDCALGHNEDRSKFISGVNASVADFSGLIAEFYSFNTVLTTTDRQALENILINKYAIP